MAMPRKTGSKSVLIPKRRIPKRIVLFSIIRDESGSMSPWRNQQGQFIPAIKERIKNIAGPNFLSTVYLQYTVITGGFVSSDIGTLDEIADPSYQPDGCTPLGSALGHVANSLQSFMEMVLFPNEVTIRNFEILLISDCYPSGEEAAKTQAGIEAFTRFIPKFNAKLTLVVPDEDAKKNEMAQQLNLSGRPIRTLAANPEDLINISFESIYQASRKLGNSNPGIRN